MPMSLTPARKAARQLTAGGGDAGKYFEKRANDYAEANLEF